MKGSYLGPVYDETEIQSRLTAAGAVFEMLDEGAVIDRCARALAAGLAVGWHQGRMEFGPRALGPDRSSAMPVRRRCRNC